MRSEKTAETHKTHRCSMLRAIIVALIVLIIMFSSVSFFRSYNQLDAELEQERMVYVREISNQISTVVYNRRDRLLSQIADSANMLDYVKAESFDDIERLFGDKEKRNCTVVLCDDNGNCYDIYGKQFPMRNNQIFSQILEESTSQYFFEKSTSGQDYWIFTNKIDPKTIDGHRFVAVFELYDIAQFQSLLSLELFNEKGFALIINQDGTVNLRPDHNRVSIGYNAISTFEAWGMPSDVADSIKSDLTSLKSNRLYVNLAGAKWLIDYKSIEDSSEFVLVVTPIAVTSAGVTSSLQLSLLSVGGVIGGIALLLFVFVLYNTQLAKKRNMELYELKLQAKMVESKNDFLAKMSHDIRTPLNAIIGMNFLATTQVEENAPVMENLKNVDTSAKYLIGILNDILDMSKIESGKMEIHNDKFQLCELLNDIEMVVKTQAQEKEIAFVQKTEPNTQGCYIGDKLRIQQILMNLISNALKFTPEGGRITVETALAEKKDDIATIRFSVSDTGIGMTDEFLKNIFTPFTQDGSDIAHKYGGSGLGLSITKSFVDMMEGSISVESHKNEGSTFMMLLPLKISKQTAPKAEEAVTAIDEGRLEGKRVLLVEDNNINMVIAKKLLLMFRMQVEEAVNGKAALELFLSNPVGYYSVIVSDIRMPEMDGYELAEQIRSSSHPDAAVVPILAMSANAFDDDVAASLSHGMNAHLKKPVDVTELKKTLCIHVREEDASLESKT